MTVLCFVSARKQVFLMSFNCKSTILNWLTLLVINNFITVQKPMLYDYKRYFGGRNC